MTTISQYELKHEQLLRELKTVVESLLSVRVSNIWAINGALKKTHVILDKIFRHGAKNSSYLCFIYGLQWLQPETSQKTTFDLQECERKIDESNLNNDSASIWLLNNLEKLTLSSKLSWLISDRKHIENCYYPWGFFYRQRYVEALLIYIKAVENNQPALLSNINPELFSLQPNAQEICKIHRRTSSFPNRHIKIISDEISSQLPIISKLTLWSSNPELGCSKKTIDKTPKTVPNTPVHGRKKATNVDFKLNAQSKEINKKKRECRAKNVRTILFDNRNIIEHTPSLSMSLDNNKDTSDKLINHSIQSLPEKSEKYLANSPRSIVDYSFSPMPGEKDYSRQPKRSFIESGGYDVVPMSTGYFPRPAKGQSLMSFLTSSQFSRTNAELDRENAHFSISEAIISALEQIRCNSDTFLNSETCDDSDPEIQDLKQRIRLRKRDKIAEKKKRIMEVFADRKSEATTVASSYSMTPDDSSNSSNIIDDIYIDEASNLTENQEMSMSMASLYSESDFRRNRGIPDGASDVFSAESVAISLISKFKEKQLPKAADLVWLVSEEDVAQSLLPLPESWPINPDDFMPIPLRGTHEWAPPRPQIIFTLHPRQTRKQLMVKQNYRCAGCSVKVAPKYVSKFRYCEYLGRYFCTGCHSNQLALIPARILQKWDFSRYAVSTFSYRLLEQMHSDRLFRIFELNKNITKLSKNIEFCQRFGLGLYYLKEFMFACKNAESVQNNLKLNLDNPFYTIQDLQLYSIDDLVKIQNGTTKNKLKYLVDLCCNHIIDCELCKAQGHICEICQSAEIIFPWQLKKVNRCDKCGNCYHKDCWKLDEVCKKCQRLTIRKASIVEI